MKNYKRNLLILINTFKGLKIEIRNEVRIMKISFVIENINPQLIKDVKCIFEIFKKIRKVLMKPFVKQIFLVILKRNVDFLGNLIIDIATWGINLLRNLYKVEVKYLFDVNRIKIEILISCR